jgi:DNA-binding response OmpR family regulator
MVEMAALSAQPSPVLRAHARKVLVVASDDELRRRLAWACSRSEIDVVEAGSGSQGLRALFEDRPDAVVIDSGLADMPDMTFLDRVRDMCDTPVLVLQDEYDEMSTVHALRSGADAVLAQPFGMAEAVARTEVLLRRAAATEATARAYSDGVVDINPSTAETRLNGVFVQLSPLEFRLLWEFVNHPRETLSHDDLLERVWGDTINGRERVKIYVGYVRARFRECGAESPIVTVRGFGYRYEPVA